MGNLHPPASRQVAVVVKFLLQLQDLLAGVGGPRALGFPTGVIGVYWTHTERRRKRKFYCPEREEGEPFLPANTVSPSLPLSPATSSFSGGVGDKKGRKRNPRKIKRPQSFGGLCYFNVVVWVSRGEWGEERDYHKVLITPLPPPLAWGPGWKNEG